MVQRLRGLMTPTAVRSLGDTTPHLRRSFAASQLLEAWVEVMYYYFREI